MAATLKSSGVKVVAFDMDQCMVKQHSRGCMTHDGLSGNLANVTPDFVAAVHALVKEGVKLAVATHSDQTEYNWLVDRTPKTHLLGDDLVWPVLRSSFPEYADELFVVAYNPNARFWFQREEDQGKRRHVRVIAEWYGVDASDVIVFDDDEDNVRLSQGFRAVKVEPSVGFRIRELSL
ncbi:unnamed protein product [Discosporangium mesarthrocarpum]